MGERVLYDQEDSLCDQNCKYNFFVTSSKKDSSEIIQVNIKVRLSNIFLSKRNAKTERLEIGLSK